MSQAFAKHNEVAKKHSYLNTILQKSEKYLHSEFKIKIHKGGKNVERTR